MLATPFPNQPPPFEGRNLATGDPLLRAVLAAHGVCLQALCADFGRKALQTVGSVSTQGPPIRSTQ